MEQKPFSVTSEDIDMFVRLVREAEEHHDGHLTIMRFTTNWRIMFGTPDGREEIDESAAGQTFHHAGNEALRKLRA